MEGPGAAADEPSANAARWSVSPNPVVDYLLLQSNTPDARAQRIRIFDAAGQLVKTLTPTNPDLIRIPASTWESGLYIVVIENEGQTERLRIIKHDK